MALKAIQSTWVYLACMANCCLIHYLEEPWIKTSQLFLGYTVQPRYNDPRYNDIPGITTNILWPAKSYSTMYGTETRYNDLRYNDIPEITMRIQRIEGKNLPRYNDIIGTQSQFKQNIENNIVIE